VSFVVVGLNHRTVPLPVLERVAVPPAEVPKALRDLAAREYLAEVALLSTCNRTEVYAFCTKFHPGVADASEFLAEQAGMQSADLAEHIYSYYDEAAIAHLFGVAAGVDSVILGEGQILGQVRDALKVAEEEGTASHNLGRIFRFAIEVGKRSRAETGIGRGAVSLSSAAVALAAELGNEETSALLAKVVDVDDPVTGTVRLRSRVATVDEMTLDTRSTRTKRVGKTSSES
jgi:glutamyl-tRNA reductase